ncbi:MAG: glycosyltransferase family 2 protein [Sphingobium sp.]|nr:glycosyltransferase family 2 protein [Sphingobium sp.]
MAEAVSRAPSLAVVIVNYCTADLTMEAVRSLLPERAAVGPFDVLIVDGKSPDGSADKLLAHFSKPEWDWVTVLPQDVNGGFGWANNQAMLRLLQRSDPPEFIHLLNPDCAVAPGAVRALLDVMAANPKVGAVGSQLLEPDGRLSGSAFRFPSPGREFVRGSGLPKLGRLLGIAPMLVERDAPGPADWVTGASVMFRSEALHRTGLFDDGFFLYFEEVELQHRLTRAGWAIWTAPASRVTHIGGAATGVESGGKVAVKPHPPYRYEARRRFFMRTGGAGGLFAANLGWLAGKLVGMPIALLRGRKAEVPREVPMTLRYCFRPRAKDFVPSIPPADEPPGRAPAWMSK